MNNISVSLNIETIIVFENLDLPLYSFILSYPSTNDTKNTRKNILAIKEYKISCWVILAGKVNNIEKDDIIIDTKEIHKRKLNLFLVCLILWDII